LPVPRLLYVEDDEMVRLLITDALQDEGFHLDIADNVAGALALLAKASYDLVLTDGRLPDGTGLEVAERATECGTRVLLYTGYAHEFSSSRHTDLTVILKPLRIAALLQHIRQALEEC
jgi:two-component system, NtrC family, response regulator HydG